MHNAWHTTDIFLRTYPFSGTKTGKAKLSEGRLTQIIPFKARFGFIESFCVIISISGLARSIENDFIV